MALLKKIKLMLLKKLAKAMIQAIMFSSRIRISGQENVAALQKENLPLIYIFWHRHILFVIHKFKNSGARPLISLSSDGELVAAVAEEFGMNPIRGSSSKGGARAFLQMARCVQNEKAAVLITADGPKGPARKVKEGAVQLAVKTGAYVIPISWIGSRVKVLKKSWDRFMLPLPFGRIHFAFGQPLRLDADTNAADQAQAGDILAAKLNQLEESL
ncbi:MAG: lysophospholipid acyltransferase family protein [Candidatus Aminicenantes bacterium]|nr:lysophospholipid acyltransferase family protein [Candidatus Aminicenantes bacterium]